MFFLLFSGFFLFSASAFATTYYVSVADGNDANCTGLSQTAYPGSGSGVACPWKTLDKVNTAMGAATIHAGDSVFFKSGETFVGYLNVTVSGSVGNILTFGSYGNGANPIIDATGLLTAIKVSNGKSYLTFENLDARNATSRQIFLYNSASNIIINNVDASGNATNGAIYISTGTFSDISITNAALSYNTQGIYLTGTSFTNITIDRVTATSGGGVRGIYLITGVYQNIDILNSTFNLNSAAGIYMAPTNLDDLNIANVTASSNTGKGVQLEASLSNTLIDSLIANSNGDNGLYINGLPIISDIIIQNSELNGNGVLNEASGLVLYGTGDNGNITNTTASNNSRDGFDVSDFWTNVTFENDTANSNGTDGLGADGDGFSFHDTSSGIMKNCIGRNNLKSAVAHISVATITIENCLFSHTTNGTLPSLVNLYNGTYNLYNNVIYSDAHTGNGLGFSTDSSNGVSGEAKNNIIDNFDIGFYKTPAVTGIVTDDYNLIYGANTSYSGLTSGVHSFSSAPLFTNAASAANFTLTYLSPAIDAGTDVSLTTDYTGTNHIYGLPDIGAYEYQPPYTIGTNNIDITSPIRLYSDGEYRYTGTASGGTQAKLTIAPTGGWPSNGYSQYMDIDIDTWNTSGTYSKQWSETGEGSLSVAHTVGDLKPNYYYKVDVEDELYGTYLSNSQGQISFTYTGGYSEHSFEVEGKGEYSTGLAQSFFAPPTTPEGGFGISIENGILALTVGQDTKQMEIANNPDFYYSTSKIPFQAQYPWSQSSGTVYARFFTDSQYGSPSETVSAKIVSNSEIPVQPNEPTEPIKTSQETTRQTILESMVQILQQIIQLYIQLLSLRT